MKAKLIGLLMATMVMTFPVNLRVIATESQPVDPASSSTTTVGGVRLIALALARSQGCGDGVADASSEECDGQDLLELTCFDFGFSGGSLTCSPNCTIDPSGCFDETISISAALKGRGKLELAGGGQKPDRIKYKSKAALEFAVTAGEQGTAPSLRLEGLGAYAISPRGKRGVSAPDEIRFSLEGQSLDLTHDFKRKTFSGCAQGLVTGLGSENGRAGGDLARVPESEVPICVSVRSRQLTFGLLGAGHRARIEVAAAADGWTVALRGRAELLPCSPTDTDGDGFGDACDRCPNNETDPECGTKPAGYWRDYVVYYSGCGCEDPDGLDFSQGETVVYEVEQERPGSFSSGACFWPPNFERSSDYCLDEFTAVDLGCGSGEATVRTVDCEFGCELGRCLCESSADSDGGDAPYVQGTTVWGNTDTCQECVEWDPSGGEFPSCLTWEDQVSCDSDENCRLLEYFAESAVDGSCSETSRIVFCTEGDATCSDGRCLGCEPEDDLFSNGDLLDRCRANEVTLVERWVGPTCEVADETSIQDCSVGCEAGRCVCGDQDGAHPKFAGTDGLGREDVCEGTDLLERWAEMVDGTCAAFESRIACANGCLEGRCLSAPGLPTYTFACVNISLPVPGTVSRSAQAINAQCRLGIIGFVEQTGIDEFVDIAITDGHEGTRPRPHREYGEGFAAPYSPVGSISGVEGNTRIVMTNRIFEGDTGNHQIVGYSEAGVNWTVVEYQYGYNTTENVPVPNDRIAHELGHSFALHGDYEIEGVDVTHIEPANRLCRGGRPCRALCDEYSFADWSVQHGERGFSCVNPFPETCDASYTGGTCAGHPADHGPPGGRCTYGKNGGPGFSTVEREHIRTWFSAWAAAH